MPIMGGAIRVIINIQHLALYNAIPLAPPILDDAPVAVFLAVLAAGLGSQKHVPSVSIYAGRSRGKVGTTSGFGGFSTVATREINQLGDVIPVKKIFLGSSCESRVKIQPFEQICSLVVLQVLWHINAIIVAKVP